jgi:hypothetical protein
MPLSFPEFQLCSEYKLSCGKEKIFSQMLPKQESEEEVFLHVEIANTLSSQTLISMYANGGTRLYV